MLMGVRGEVKGWIISWGWSPAWLSMDEVLVKKAEDSQLCAARKPKVLSQEATVGHRVHLDDLVDHRTFVLHAPEPVCPPGVLPGLRQEPLHPPLHESPNAADGDVGWHRCRPSTKGRYRWCEGRRPVVSSPLFAVLTGRLRPPRKVSCCRPHEPQDWWDASPQPKQFGCNGKCLGVEVVQGDERWRHRA